ncbi:MAG: hypothetical protein IJW41_00095 [Oscillospiraceae bacterium]|nr:hypothetical protein [Oscillospiraceae bacterium]
MAGRKYVSDYRIEKAITPSGKVETKLFYQGTYYRYERSREEILRLRRHILLVTVLSALLIFPMLMTPAMLSHTIYIILPAAFSLVPMYLLLAGARRLGFDEEKFTREHRDKTEKRIARASLWLTILLGTTVAGCVVYICLCPVILEEYLCMGSLLLALAGSATLLPQRKKAKAVEIEK